MTYSTIGFLQYSMSPEGHKLIVEVDRELIFYTRSLIPKALYPQPTRYAPHITVVRKETPTNLAVWGLHEGDAVDVTYDPQVAHNDTYFWLRCWCAKLTQIRRELGLDPSTEYTRPPDGEDCFHSTVATRKR